MSLYFFGSTKFRRSSIVVKQKLVRVERDKPGDQMKLLGNFIDVKYAGCCPLNRNDPLGG